MLIREEWAHRAQGKKVLEGRCGRTIEAKPVFDQTRLIEPAKDVAWLQGQGDMAMAAAPRLPAGSCRHQGNIRTRRLPPP
ncbi:hypothetical protein ATY76_22085 [Rhizobium sp. R339]|nr:hypothetical protein ATY76_22085 [Rhizobium sp. R339]